VHRRPDRWPDGESFAPERFAEQRPLALLTTEDARRSYFPFGEGPRTCIGNHFAELEGRAVVATVAQRVSLEVVGPKDPQTTTAFAIRPRDHLRARVHRA
jgi:cytochrome P450